MDGICMHGQYSDARPAIVASAASTLPQRWSLAKECVRRQSAGATRWRAVERGRIRADAVARRYDSRESLPMRWKTRGGSVDAHGKRGSRGVCGDPDRPRDHGPDPGRFRAYMAAGAEGHTRTRAARLALLLHLAGIRRRPALAADSCPRCPRVARVAPDLVAAVQSARHLPRAWRGSLLGRLR